MPPRHASQSPCPRRPPRVGGYHFGASPLEATRNDRTRQAHTDIVGIAEAHALSQVGEPFP
jgi:hypothetical protein